MNLSPNWVSADLSAEAQRAKAEAQQAKPDLSAAPEPRIVKQTIENAETRT